ncbi:ABC transporter ATP-binding protein [Nostoc sp. UHCC 0252]|uniref:ABC transporter ATP-binding protein n=1 Tax=Nostoc sp. UHCC 0252 TaxID=3110241 RepID=UPI002B21CFC4|nr:ABC transporter ATP-binding protein [Nostoc sp. UHCC 0252]MEA5600745.1 ABC transporter ATP-binding protein [Nostoc sp. UHCC 0252]
MGEEIAISLKNVSKCYKRYHHPVERLREILLPNKSYGQEFWALQNINLEIPKGQTSGIIGRNGSGKSTLLQIIAGTLMPTTGQVQVQGRISALLELGSGFNPEFTGRQNVFFNGRLLGLSQQAIEDKFDDIIGFADIGDFIDEPVKTYSSGMFVRLAFAVAVNVEPEILIVDEALSVGDGVFVHRCMAKIKDFQDAGGTILFVSHDLGSVSRLCSEAIWINDGQIVEQGKPIDISKSYQAWMYDKINERLKKDSDYGINVQSDKETLPNVEVILDVSSDNKSATNNKINPFTSNEYLAFHNTKRFGTGRCEIISLEVLNEQGEKTGFVMPDEWLILQTKIISYDDILSPIVGMTIFDRLRVSVTAWNTTQCKYQLPKIKKNQLISVNFKIKWPHIKSDNYSLEPAIADGNQDSHEMMDWLQACVAIQSGVTDLTFGFMRLTDVNINHTLEVVTINHIINQK